MLIILKYLQAWNEFIDFDFTSRNKRKCNTLIHCKSTTNLVNFRFILIYYPYKKSEQAWLSIKIMLSNVAIGFYC